MTPSTAPPQPPRRHRRPPDAMRRDDYHPTNTNPEAQTNARMHHTRMTISSRHELRQWVHPILDYTPREKGQRTTKGNTPAPNTFIHPASNTPPKGQLTSPNPPHTRRAKRSPRGAWGGNPPTSGVWGSPPRTKDERPMSALSADMGLPASRGAEGNRTPDLLDANETRYQLCYSPVVLRLSPRYGKNYSRAVGGGFATPRFSRRRVGSRGGGAGRGLRRRGLRRRCRRRRCR
jgi:hypothetical protein